MAFFNEFPHSRTYDDDLGWLIKAVRKIITEVGSVNEITYADPINWSIARQYPKNQIVKDEESGVLYLSKQPVPAGIPLVNEDYWLVIGNFDYQITFLKDAISAKDEGNAVYSSAEYIKGKYIWWNEKLYKTTDTIAIGDVLSSDNLEEITTGEALAQLENQIEDNKQTRIKRHFRYWIDGINGSDDNNGTGASTPFKTIDRFLQESDKYTELRAYIMTPGTYPVTIGDNAAGVSVHIQSRPNIGNVTIDFKSHEEVADPTEVSIYLAHWNISPMSTDQEIIIDAHNLYTGNQSEIYFDNCLLTLDRVRFLCRFRTYGGTLQAQRITFPTMASQNAVVSITDGCTITNTKDATAMSFINCYGRIQGNINAAELSADDYANNLIVINAGEMYIGTNVPATVLANQYNYGINLSNGALLKMSESNLNNTINRNRAGVSFTDTRCAIITNNGIRQLNSVRYSGGALQYWNGSAWTAIS